MNGHLSVLVVDDFPDSASTLATLLNLQGHHAYPAMSSAEALFLIETKPLDVVILDIGLPHMDGYEVARRIRKLDLHPRPLIIAITGLSNRLKCLDDHYQHPSDSDIDHYLLKPVEPSDLLRMLEQVY